MKNSENFNVDMYKININDAKKVIDELGCDKGGIKILASKTKTHTLFIKNLHVGAANILKQDALSIGADLAVPTGVIVAQDEYVDAILIGSTKHLETLARKELSQPYGLKQVAKKIKEFINQKLYTTKIMGVLNANADSFYKDSRFDNTQASIKIEQMIDDGANIIDIGAVSSKPGSTPVSAEVELERIQDIINTIYTNKYYDKVDFSIDSYEPLVIDFALNNGFKIVNDITGLANDEVCKVSAKYDASVVIMHMQNDPRTMQDNPVYDNVILDIDKYFKNQISKANSFGINNIILDVGIGFGKTLNHNLDLLNNLEHFKHLGCELLIGASRKSLIDKIYPCNIEERLPGTLAIHLKSIEKGASIVRCHDVKEHKQAISVLEAINSIN